MKGIKFALVLVLLLAAIGAVNAASLSLSLNSLEAISEGDTTTLTATVTAVGDSVSNVSLQLGSLPTGTNTSDSLTQSVGTLSSGQSSSKSWTIRGDVAGNYTFNITASGTSVSDVFQNASLVVNTAAYIDISSKTCSASALNVGNTITMNFIVRNTGGSSATVSINMSGYSSKLTLSSGSASSSFALSAGSQSSKSYVFTAASAGTATITAGITSTQNDPTDQTCSVTITSTDTNTTTTTTATTTTTTTSNAYAKNSEALELVTVNDSEFNALLDEAGYSSQEKAAGLEIAKKLTITRKVTKYKGTGDNNYRTDVALTIANPTTADYNIYLIENIPKTFTSNSANINFGQSHLTVKSDPILSFEILLLKSASYEVGYSAKTDFNVEKISEFKVAFAQSIPPKIETPAADQCLGKNCDDNNPCTIDSCFGGACANTNAAENTQCTGGKCVAGKCIKETAAVPAGTQTTAGPGEWNIYSAIGWVLLVAGVVLIAAHFFRKSKGHRVRLGKG